MSFMTEKEIECPNCSFPNSVEIWTIINASTDPELKELLIGGEINLIKCQSCREIFFADEFFLFHDKDNELMAFVYPSSDAHREEELKKQAMMDFQESQATTPDMEKLDYEPLVLFGMESLIALLNNEEEMKLQSEILLQLSKIHRISVVKLKPSAARLKGLPFVIPVSNVDTLPMKKAILEGISLLENFNDRLNVYRSMRTLLESKDEIDIPVINEKESA